MSEIAGNAVAGIFGLISMYLAWRLGIKNSKLEMQKEIRREKEDLYQKIYMSFEQAISEIKYNKERTVISEFFKLNAKISILSREEIAQKYFECCHKLEAWSDVRVKAYPNNQLIQAPDPTRKYKELEAQMHEDMQAAIQHLVELMRSDLSGT